MDVTAINTDPDHHTDFNPDVHPASYRDLKPASVRNAESESLALSGISAVDARCSLQGA
jgi:hypothetical protein